MKCIHYCAFLSLALCMASAHLTASPERTAVAFDIHNVLVVPDAAVRSAAIRHIITRSLGTIFADMGRALVGYADNRRPYALCGRLIQLLSMGDISGEGFSIVCEQYGYPELSEQVIVISQAYNPVPGIQDVIQELKSQNIHVMVASNIGTRFYELLAQKDDDTKKLFETFDASDPGVTVEFVRPDGTIVHKPIKKPNHAYFAQVLQKAQEAGAQRVIFLDDNKSYVEQAQEAGLEAFQFDARAYPENAAQALRAEFVKRNVLSENP